MDYRFIRKLILAEETEIEAKISQALQAEGIEVFIREPGETVFYNLPAGMHSTDGCLYVSAADLERARELVTEAGYGDCLTDGEMPEGIKTELEKAEEAYYKKRKWLYIECAVVIVAGILWMLYQGLR